MRYLIALIMIMFGTNACAWSDWTLEQRRWYLASNIAIVADWATTRDLSRRYDEGYYEVNPLVGRRPSTGRVDQHFIGSLILHYFITDWLDDDRMFYLKTVTVVEGALVAHNLNIGLRLRF